MAIGTLFGSNPESSGLYGNNPTIISQTYFEWFIFTTSAGTPATPTGGSWDFNTNTGTAPAGWSNFISGVPLNSLWFSVAFVDSRNPTVITWTSPGLVSSQSVYATAYADVFTGNGSTVAWTLTQDPVVVNNTDVSINGVTQVPGTDYTLSGTTLTTTTAAPLNAIILVKYRQALPLSYYGAASNVQYTPAGTGAVSTNVQAKLRESVSVKDFGAVGDSNGTSGNGTDDSIAIYKAFDYAKSIGAEVWFPAGVYRVTYGYTQSVAYNNIFLRGCGRVGEPIGTSLSSVIFLDSTNAASYFMKLAVSGTVVATGMNFKCAQAVVDRPFFKFQSNNPHFFYNCDFEDVERPFVYASTCYFQNAAYRDVQFRGTCGTFHSENTTLACTLMLIDNVNHESTVPTTNTEKIVCNLTGIRQLFANNFLLEGALPAAGWTILKLSNPYDALYTRANFAIFNNFHSEWSGAYTPTYAVDQVGGNVQWNFLVGIDPAFPYKISSLGSVDMSNVSFVGTTADPSTYFSLENSQCVVRLTNCSARSFNTFNTSVLYRMMQVADINNGQGQVVIDSTDSDRAYKWNGGYVLADNVTSNYIPGGESNYPATDATYGRKLVLVPGGSGAVGQNIVIPAVIKAGMQVTIMARMKLPTFASGVWAALNCDIGTLNAIDYRSTTDSGAVIDTQVTRVAIADLTSISISFTNGTTPGATGGTMLEIYDLAIFVGSQIPRRLFPEYPKNILTYNGAVPTTGTWKAGDAVKNNAPAVGSPKGWICTVAGTPGTWVSEGNL